MGRHLDGRPLGWSRHDGTHLEIGKGGLEHQYY
jgi:hypothetical protein